MVVKLKSAGSIDACFNHLTDIVFDKIAEGVMINDKEGTVIYINKKLEEILGYTFPELVGLSHKQVVNLLLGKYHNYQDIESDWNKIACGAKANTARRRFTHKNGQTVPLEVNAFPVSEEGAFSGELLLIKDLHEELLIRVTELVNSSLSINEVLNNTIKAVVDYLGLASNTIFLLDKEQSKLNLVACTVFPNQEEVNKVSFKIGEGIPGVVAASKKSKYVENLRNNPYVSEQARTYHGDESCMVYPLICKDELLGVIAFNADTIREFNKRERQMFENIANQVALAVYNAQLFSKLEHLSCTDGLTGLYNHRYFHERLKEEINRSVRAKTPLSLLMLDVDNFKNYNDTFGHVYGDELLKDIASLIKKNVRNIDIVARYGGEEFTVILINCQKQEALKIAERIRKSIEDYEFYGREKQPKGKVTISIGLSMHTERLNSKALLAHADKALYKAKNSGRNKVETLI